jgi:hypothetical protein
MYLILYGGPTTDEIPFNDHFIGLSSKENMLLSRGSLRYYYFVKGKNWSSKKGGKEISCGL